MTTIQFKLRDFPADVQDILKQRAVEQRRAISEVIHDYLIEVSKTINDSAATQST